MATLVSGVGLEDVERSPGSGTVSVRFDPETVAASTAVIATLADILDADLVELRPLRTTVDPDALDALVGGRDGEAGDVHVTFTHEGYRIRADSGGLVTIALPEHAGEAGR